jgi:hypothetical protein
VLRCVLYSADVVVWCAVWVAVIALFAWDASMWPPPNPLGEASALVPLVLGIWLTYRLFTAYSLYLRFDHAAAVVLASQAIVALVFWKLWYVAQGL